MVVLVDGDNHQIMRSLPMPPPAPSRSRSSRFIHVLEYLWKARCVVHSPRHPAAETGCRQALDSLQSMPPSRRTGSPRSPLETRPAPAASTARSSARPCTPAGPNPNLDYPRGLANSWPIATASRGACRHLVRNRMGIPAPSGPARAGILSLWVIELIPSCSPRFFLSVVALRRPLGRRNFFIGVAILPWRRRLAICREHPSTIGAPARAVQ